MDCMKLTITSYKKKQFQGEFDLIIAPGILGHLGCQYGDRTFLTLLKPGVVYLFNKKILETRFFIFGGQIIAKNNEVFIHVPFEIIDLKKINRGDIDKLIDSLENNLINLKSEKNAEYIKNYLDKEINENNSFKINVSLQYYKEKIEAYNLLAKLIDSPEY